jgi:DNA primase
VSWLDDLVTRTHARLLDLPATDPARAYLASRNVSPELIARFKIGWSGEVTIGTCSPEFALWANKYWLNRLVFPVTSLTEGCAGLVTRPLPAAGEKRRYEVFALLKTEVYPVAFGLRESLPEIWERKQVVVTEGIFDALALAPHVPHVIATLMASPPLTLKRFFERYVTEVVAMLDMDDAGRRAAEKLAAHLRGKVRVTTLNYGEKDPGEAAQRGELEPLLRMLRLRKVIE